MTLGRRNDTVEAVRIEAAARLQFEEFKRRAKAHARKDKVTMPLSSDRRRENYQEQAGWGAKLTPRQRRRLVKKDRRAIPVPAPVLWGIENGARL